MCSQFCLHPKTLKIKTLVKVREGIFHHESWRLTRETFDHDGNLEQIPYLPLKFMFWSDGSSWNSESSCMTGFEIHKGLDQFGGIRWRRRDTSQREIFRDGRVTYSILSSSICFLPISDSTSNLNFVNSSKRLPCGNAQQLWSFIKKSDKTNLHKRFHIRCPQLWGPTFDSHHNKDYLVASVMSEKLFSRRSFPPCLRHLRHLPLLGSPRSWSPAMRTRPGSILALWP